MDFSYVVNISLKQDQAKRMIPSQLAAVQLDQLQLPVSYCRDD